jgi:EGF-like domain
MKGVQTPFSYTGWDASKQQACVCDEGFDGSDCSLRSCPVGHDPLRLSSTSWCGNAPCVWETQSFTLKSAGPTVYSFTHTDIRNISSTAYVTLDIANDVSNGYVDPSSQSTLLPGAITIAGKIMNALRNTPQNILTHIEVYPRAAIGSVADPTESRTYRVTFVGVPGNQAPLQVSAYSGPGGLDYNPDHPNYSVGPNYVAGTDVVVTKQLGNYQAIECAGRGICDTTTGVCSCFAGYIGPACDYLNAISG